MCIIPTDDACIERMKLGLSYDVETNSVHCTPTVQFRLTCFYMPAKNNSLMDILAARSRTNRNTMKQKYKNIHTEYKT